MSVTALCMAPFIAKKRNTATQASLVYPPDTLLFGCQALVTNTLANAVRTIFLPLRKWSKIVRTTFVRVFVTKASVSVRLRGRQISQIKFNLWMTRAYLYSPSCPNGIAFLNTVLLFVNNHGNCKMICLCVHIHQNGHQYSSTFKVMIEKLTVSSGPSRSGLSQFCVTDLTFICKSHVRHRQSQVRHGQFFSW